jgi:predicted N-acetyltransferase YhbS
MELVEFRALPDRVRADVVGDEQDPWDSAGLPPLQWRDKEQHVALRDERGQYLASAGVLVVEAEAGGARFRVAGLGGVIVNRAHRGQGLSLRVIEAALAKAATLGTDFVLLFCHADRIGLYTRFGFEEVAADVLVQDGDGQLTMPMHTMWRALRPGPTWPQGPVVLHSPPF